MSSLDDNSVQTSSIVQKNALYDIVFNVKSLFFSCIHFEFSPKINSGQ